MSVSRTAIVIAVSGVLAAIAVAVVLTLAFLPGDESASIATALGQPASLSEGVKVHGSWQIDVRDPDGSLVTHREFENEFHDHFNILPNVLTGEASMGNFEVTAENFSSDAPCLYPGVGVSAKNCRLSEPTNTEPDAIGLSKNLIVSVSGTDQVSLSGSIIADRDGEINVVRTVAGMCASSIAPSDCHDVNRELSFSGVTINGVAVVQGQFVGIAVDFTFVRPQPPGW